ncbi:Molybdopterin synthase catalytic subunit [Acropora cervicornis]|uniref:Molybdopterin synthase catalytic subunit n=1 Tax=Acropora cervicornis TaxID=6130 RepID=A0AAD9QLA8_ACRCE|nr:Molybdopterin synthase catalytic subunit [Acropora cervicornis]
MKEESKLGSAGLQMADDTIVITPDHLHVDKVTEIVGSPSAGAISLFVGTTRDNFEGKTVVRLEYEAYVPMARSEIRKICKQVREKWDVIKIAIFHRIGKSMNKVNQSGKKIQSVSGKVKEVLLSSPQYDSV